MQNSEQNSKENEKLKPKKTQVETLEENQRRRSTGTPEFFQKLMTLRQNKQNFQNQAPTKPIISSSAFSSFQGNLPSKP